MSKPKNSTFQTTDGDHQHHFELVYYDGKKLPEHIHPYKGETSYDVGHAHRIYGATGPGPNVSKHVHKYKGTTTFDDGHVHHYAGVTGPAIPTPDGGHFHLLEGQTTVDAHPGGIPHSHRYWGITEK